MKERDVLLQSQVDDEQTMDFPITRLKNIVDKADIKEAPGEGDYIPVMDGSDGGQMKKMPWAAVGQLVEDAISKAIDETIEEEY